MNRYRFRLALMISLLTAILPLLARAEPPPQQAIVHPLVWEALQAEGEAEILVVLRAQADLSTAETLPTKEAKGRYVYETLRAVAKESQQALRTMLDAQEIEYQSFYIVNALKLRARGSLVQSLANRFDVAQILPNPWVKGVPDRPDEPASISNAAPQGIEDNIERVHAPRVWSLGFTGQGIVVAGQDTGYDWQHPALKNQYRGWDGASADHNYNWHDAIHSGGGACAPDAPEPCDDLSHGTHTMGIIVGDDGGLNQIGMAPGARWIGCRNMDEGFGTPATYMECFEFFLAPYPVDGSPGAGNPALAPHVVNNSWSCPTWEGCDADTLEAAVEALRQAGIIVVVSAGNHGSACETVLYPPTTYQQSFSVGAFNHSTDQIASFSSRGPVTYGGETYVKPNIAAPGVSIKSSVPGSDYDWISGTSMAAPHVAGAVALLLSAAPGYAGQVDAIEAALTTSAESKSDSQCSDPTPPNNVWGWGILDTLAAVEWIAAGSLQGAVTDADDGAPVAGATVTARLVSGTAKPVTVTDLHGAYTLALAAGDYDVTADAAGYFPQTIENVTVASGEVEIQDFALEPAQRTYFPIVYRSP
jgi:subtilisin family serine protease